MSYYTTVKVVNKDGKPVKAEVRCGGTGRGFTDANTGELSFDLSSQDNYGVSVKRYDEIVSGNVRGGKKVTLRLNK
jgi:hypothetical protein